MYHIYKLLTDAKGNIIHRTPIAKSQSLKSAQSYARVWSNGHPIGIYKINPDGTESKVN